MSQFPCLEVDTHAYRGCTGIECPFFDTMGILPGCLFYPRLNNAKRLTDANRLRRLKVVSKVAAMTAQTGEE